MSAKFTVGPRMEALIAFWTHALAAALFASLTLWELRRGLGESEQRMLLAAFALTGCLGVDHRACPDDHARGLFGNGAQPGLGRRSLPPGGHR